MKIRQHPNQCRKDTCFCLFVCLFVCILSSLLGDMAPKENHFKEVKLA